eukprot:784628-Prymnesium_polylepis.2
MLLQCVHATTCRFRLGHLSWPLNALLQPVSLSTRLARGGMGDEDEEALAAARAKAATRIAAAQRGKKARQAKREQDDAATKLQAIHRGRVARRRRF